VSGIDVQRGLPFVVGAGAIGTPDGERSATADVERRHTLAAETET
jgi:hypothetical protein